MKRIVKGNHLRVEPELPASHYRAIGKMCFKIAFLETTLKQIVYMLIGRNRRIGRAEVKISGAVELIDMINEHIDARKLSLTPISTKLRKAVKESNRNRDWLAHANWIRSAINGELKMVLTRGKNSIVKGEGSVNRVHKPEAMPMTDKNFRNMLDSIDASIREILEYGDVVLKTMGLTREALRPDLGP